MPFVWLEFHKLMRRWLVKSFRFVFGLDKYTLETFGDRNVERKCGMYDI